MFDEFMEVFVLFVFMVFIVSKGVESSCSSEESFLDLGSLDLEEE